MHQQKTGEFYLLSANLNVAEIARARRILGTILILWSSPIGPEQSLPPEPPTSSHAPSDPPATILPKGSSSPRGLIPTQKGPSISSEDFIRTFQKQARRELPACLEDSGPEEKISLLLSAVIDHEGNIKTLRTLGPQDVLSPCLREAILAMNFKELTGNFPLHATVTVQWRIDL
jgi:hypothetical protein